ncbi:unnamed protein product [Merluccius merluccius]
MDEPPGSLDDLQPQDLSACGAAAPAAPAAAPAAALDLARRGEAPSLAAVHMAKSPRWFPANAGNGRAGLAALADAAAAAAASSDAAGVQPGGPVQSDNAFSNTTVTLSYVSRSRVFPSSQDAMSTHSSLYGAPSIGKFALQSSREAESGLGEALSQHYLQHADGPGLDRAARTQLFQALAQAQVGAENDSHGLNGGLACGEGWADARLRAAPFESGVSLENGGQRHSWPASGQSSPDAGEPQGGGRLGSGEVFREPSAVGDGPVHYSGSADPLDRVSVPCPQASRPPGAVNCCPEASAAAAAAAAAADEVIWDGLDAENPIDPFPSEQAESSGDCTVPRLDASAEPTAPARKRKAAPARKRKPPPPPPPPMDELTDDGEFVKPQKNASKIEPAVVVVVPHINGNAKTLPGNTPSPPPSPPPPPRRKLPERLGRGTRLEAFVLNICPSAYKVAKPKRADKATPNASPKASPKSPPKSPKKTAAPPKPPGLPVSPETKRTAASPSEAARADRRVITDNCKDSTSDCEIFSNSKNLHSNGTPSKTAASHFSAQGKSKRRSSSVPRRGGKTKRARKTSGAKTAAQQRLDLDLEPGEIAFPYTLAEAEVKVKTPTPKSPKKSRSKDKGAATGGGGGGGVSPPKAVRPPKRRRKNNSPPGGHAAAMFSPKEPEIKLKYVNFKEERRDPRLDSFSPLVRARHRRRRRPSSPSSCRYTVINYAEEDSTRRQGSSSSSGSFLSGATPATSCLRLGRVSAHGQHRRSLVCCLCGASANATGLGDLHGPYYPEGYRSGGKTKAGAFKSGAEEDGEEGGDEEEEDSSNSSDSSASSCGARARPRPAPALWPQRGGGGGVRLQKKGPSGSHAAAAAKRARTDAAGGGGGVLGEDEDWYSPPLVPQEPCEFWLHEDCGVWAAGVFLVKGKVYGLGEAVKVAQAMMCSGCGTPGATLGCLFKGCPNKYHYRCAVDSDCVLVEENFSMKCKKHKNKSLKAPGGNRRDDR